MKKWYKFLFLPILILALAGCSKDDDDVVDNDNDNESIEVEDGKVTQLQKHTIGNGVPIVIMGERFLNSDIVYGKYREATTWALEELFSGHPMKSLRDYFDVYEVTTVSYGNKSEYTAFGSEFEGRILQGNCDKAVEYAKKAIGEERIDDATIIILNNEEKYGGSGNPYATFPSYVSDIPKGCSVAFVSLIDDSKKYLLLHEAIGHGFAKLADEYVEDDEPINETDKEWLMEEHGKGYYRNISYDSDVKKSYWADFAADSRYDFEKLGCYEGVYYYESGATSALGVYRPTENSIMNAPHLPNGLSFNVAGRVMIYKRCMKIAYGDSWTFNYEDFVKFDLEKAKAEYKADQERSHSVYSKSMRSCAPPRFVNMKASR